jgi:hypothetical protein
VEALPGTGLMGAGVGSTGSGCGVSCATGLRPRALSASAALLNRTGSRSVVVSNMARAVGDGVRFCTSFWVSRITSCSPVFNPSHASALCTLFLSLSSSVFCCLSLLPPFFVLSSLSLISCVVVAVTTIVASVVLECVVVGAGVGVGTGIGAGAAVSNSKVVIGSVVVCLTLVWVESGSCVGAVVVGAGAGDGAVAAVSDPIGLEFGVDVSAGGGRAGVGTGADVGVGVGMCTGVFGSGSAGVMTVTGQTFDWVSTDSCTAAL